MKNIDVNNKQELIAAGYKALTESLGPIGFAKFMQYINPGKGDYTQEKYESQPLTFAEIKATLTK